MKHRRAHAVSLQRSDGTIVNQALSCLCGAGRPSGREQQYALANQAPLINFLQASVTLATLGRHFYTRHTDLDVVVLGPPLVRQRMEYLIRDLPAAYDFMTPLFAMPGP